ncbi:MAG TPA: septum site-determining protein MinD [Chloroflexi bacterium]|nr:septum site-determining protein MinD [Chloroflexota bacterium]
MAGRVLTITSGKGGVGKTTVTANLGAALAARGQRVVVVDADIGLRNLDVMMGLENRVVYDLVDVVEERCRLRQALVRDKRLSELYLLPAAQTRDKTAVGPDDMVRVCGKLRESFDYVLVDSPAGIEQGFRNALAPADEVLIVTNPEVAAVRDADRVIGLIEADERGPARLIINRIKPEMVRRGDMMDTVAVIELLAVELIGIVPEDEAVITATNTGRPVVFSDSNLAGRAFHNIARRLLGEDVPFLPLREPGFFARLMRFVRTEGGRS